MLGRVGERVHTVLCLPFLRPHSHWRSSLALLCWLNVDLWNVETNAKQPYQYTHGMHPNVLGVLHRFRGSSALIRPWVKNSESIPDNVECVSNHDCLSSRIHFLVTRRREACCRCKFPEPFFTRYTVVQFYGSVLSSLESLPRRLNSRDVASILSQVCLGLSYLQDTFGVQHNDVHENHVFVTPSGFLKIGGFNMVCCF